MNKSDIGRPFYRSTKEILFEQLKLYESISKELFDGLSRCFDSKVNSPEMTTHINKVVAKFVEHDEIFQGEMKKAVSQLERHREIKSLQEEMARKDEEILQFYNKLKEPERTLATALYQAKKKLTTGEQAKASSVTCEDLIRFAFRISSGNSVEAPADWMPGDPRRPYPLDIEMRCGVLGQLSQNVAQQSENDTSNMLEEVDVKVEKQENVRNGGLWNASSSDDTHLSSMPVSAMLNNGPTTVEDVEFMSSSSDSTSSGESN